MSNQFVIVPKIGNNSSRLRKWFVDSTGFNMVEQALRAEGVWSYYDVESTVAMDLDLGGARPARDQDLIFNAGTLTWSGSDAQFKILTEFLPRARVRGPVPSAYVLFNGYAGRGYCISKANATALRESYISVPVGGSAYEYGDAGYPH